MRANETTTYRWDDPKSIIQRVDVRQQSNGWAVAYLYANPNPDLKTERLNIRAALRLKGWGTLSDHRNGEFGLRVTGLRSGDDLVALLQSEHLVGVPHDQKISVDAASKKPSTLWGTIRANSLQWSGILATIGNAMSFASGIHRGKDKGQMAQGLLFGAADLPLMIAGKRDDARQLGNFLRQLKNHYDKEGIEIPKTASIYVETSDKGKGFGERSMDFMHRYANQIKCSFEVLAAGATIRAGFTQNSSAKKLVPLIWGPGFLASLLIPERKIDEEKYEKAGFLERFWMKIQSNPLSVGGVAGWSNNIGSYVSSFNEHKTYIANGSIGPKLYRWDAAIPSVMVGANGLYAMSKKTVGGDIKSDSMINDAYTVAAQIINKQPEALRAKAIESTAKFFGERVEIPEHHAEAVRRLRQEVELQRQNPWFEPLGLAPYTPAPKHGQARNADEVASAPSQTPPPTPITAGAAPTNLVTAMDAVHTGVTQQTPARSSSIP